MFGQCSSSANADRPYVVARYSSDGKKAARSIQARAGNDTPLHVAPMFCEGLTDRGVRSLVSLSDGPDIVGGENLYGGEAVAVGKIGTRNDLP